MAEADDIGYQTGQHASAAHPIPSLNLKDLPVNLRILQGMAPMIVFWGTSQVGPGWLAIILSMATGAFVFFHNKEYGATRALSAISFVIAASSAVAGIALESEKTFVAQNIFGDLVFIVIAMGSIVIGKPIAGVIVREMFPTLRPHIPTNDTIFVALTLVVIAANVMQGGMRLWMLEEMSASDYVVASRVAGLPFNLVYLLVAWGLIAYRLRQLRQLPHHSPAKML